MSLASEYYVRFSPNRPNMLDCLLKLVDFVLKTMHFIQQMGGTGAYPCCYGFAEKVVFSAVKVRFYNTTDGFVLRMTDFTLNNDGFCTKQ